MELAYCAEQLAATGAAVVTVDVGTSGSPTHRCGISREAVAACHPRGSDAVLGCHDRGAAVAAMGDALSQFLIAAQLRGAVGGVLGLGGSGGTALITSAMRALPIGLPKLMVSTVASGNVAPYVGCTDITMMHSVVDVAGLNSVLRIVLSNAARALAGMLDRQLDASTERPALGMTMFGVTTSCVDAVRTCLESDGFECLVFHATGSGGRAMEKLVDSGMLRGALDITTTEVADEVVGGVFPAGPQRFDAILSRAIPYVMSLGALDMVNFGASETVPERFRDRRLHVHNPQVTLMRTTPDENRQFARWIAAKLNRSASPVTLLIPERGLSALDREGQPFYDPLADAALFEELEAAIHPAAHRRIRRLPLHINDPAFAGALIDEFRRLWMRHSQTGTLAC